MEDSRVSDSLGGRPFLNFLPRLDEAGAKNVWSDRYLLRRLSEVRFCSLTCHSYRSFT